MAFALNIPTFVLLEAKLTDYGKKKLYESIEGGENAPFITKFALGDSDANYVATENGHLASSLTNVPQGGDFKAAPRSFALWKGKYRPGSPVIFKDGDEVDIFRDFSIQGANQRLDRVIGVELNTEWPAGQSFAEEYDIEMFGPSNFSEERWGELFSHSLSPSDGGWKLNITFHGLVNVSEIARLAGAAFDNESDFTVTITGKQTKLKTNIYFRMTAN